MGIISYIKKLKEKKYLRDATYTYISSLVNGASLFLISVILGRNFSKEWFAVFTLSILVLSTVSEMSDLGLNGGLLRFAPFYIAHKELDKLKQLVKTIWRWRVSIAAIITCGGIMLSYPLSHVLLKQEGMVGYLIFSFIGVGGVIFLGFINTYLQAAQRFFYNAGLQTLKGTLRLGLIALLMMFGVDNIYFYLAVYIFVPWILFFASFHVLPKNFLKVEIDQEVKKNIHAQLAKFSMWLTIWSLFSIVSSRVDQIMISRFLGLQEVAIYAAAYQLIQLYPYIAQSITAVLSPRINSLASVADVKIFLKRTLKWILLIIVILSILVFPSQYLITFFFGQGYTESLSVYLVLAYSLVLNLITVPFSLVITVYNRTYMMAFSGVVQLIVNVVGTILLIPRFGVIGAGYTFMLGIIVAVFYNIGCAYYLLKNKEIIVR